MLVFNIKLPVCGNKLLLYHGKLQNKVLKRNACSLLSSFFTCLTAAQELHILKIPSLRAILQRFTPISGSSAPVVPPCGGWVGSERSPPVWISSRGTSLSPLVRDGAPLLTASCCLCACVRTRVCLCTREYGRQQTHAGSHRPAVKIHERTPAHSFPPGGQAVTFDLSSGKRQVSSPVTGGHVRTLVRPTPSHPSLLTLSSPSLPVSCTTLHLGCKPDRSKKNDERLFFLLLLLQLARLTSNFLQLFVSL